MSSLVVDDIDACFERGGQPVAREGVVDGSVPDQPVPTHDDQSIGRERQGQVMNGAHDTHVARARLVAQQAHDALQEHLVIVDHDYANRGLPTHRVLTPFCEPGQRRTLHAPLA